MPSAIYESFEQQGQLNSLLEQAAVERDRDKFCELLRKISRLRAAMWLAGGLNQPDMDSNGAHVAVDRDAKVA
jgi:hypothetical protein